MHLSSATLYLWQAMAHGNKSINMRANACRALQCILGEGGDCCGRRDGLCIDQQDDGLSALRQLVKQ